MKRKVIQLSNQTQLVSLPRRWSRSQSIKKGEELELEIQGSRLIISSGEEKTVKSITINVETFNEKEIKWIITSLYKLGYDEVSVHYSDSQQAGIIPDILKALTGYTIIEQGSAMLTIRSISKEIDSEFEVTSRRAFLVILSLGQGCVELLQKGAKDNLPDLFHFEITNNKLTNFCQRIITKGIYKDYVKGILLYLILWNLEKICDAYVDFCRDVLALKRQPSKALLDFLGATNGLLKSYYEWFYKFDLRALPELDAEQKKILKQYWQEQQWDVEARAALRLYGIVERVTELFPTTCAINAEQL